MGSSGSKFSSFDGPALVLRRLPLRKWMLRFVNAISSDAHGLVLSVGSVKTSQIRVLVFSHWVVTGPGGASNSTRLSMFSPL
jgi:hypothetical protein